MSVTLSKLLPLIVYPLNLALWFLLAALFLAAVGRRRWAGFFGGLALLVLGVAGSPPVAGLLNAELEGRHLPVTVMQTPAADAIVLLGGGIGGPNPPRLSEDLNGAADRVLHSARLFRAGKAPLVIVSGGNVFPQRTVEAEAVYTRALLREWGVPADRVAVEGVSRNTYENALETKKLLEARGLRRVLLVTSARHMPRALGLFRGAGIDAVPVPTDFRVVNYDQPAALDWIPNADALSATTEALHEYLGMAFARWKGWMP
jgi:uncharacterized SAM-binding protein YcdF (DUF218 family)